MSKDPHGSTKLGYGEGDRVTPFLTDVGDVPRYERTEHTYHLQQTGYPEGIGQLYDASGLHGLRVTDGGPETFQGLDYCRQTTGGVQIDAHLQPPIYYGVSQNDQGYQTTAGGQPTPGGSNF